MISNEDHEPELGDYSSEHRKMLKEEAESAHILKISNNLETQGSFHPIHALKKLRETLAKLF